MNRNAQTSLLLAWLLSPILFFSPMTANAEIAPCNPVNYDWLTDAGRQAYVDCQATQLNNLANNAFETCKKIFGEAACNNARDTAKGVAQGAEETLGDALVCSADPVRCIENLARKTGADDPALTKVAILSGTVSYDTGGLIFSDSGVTTVSVGYDASKVSDACRALVVGWFGLLGDVQQGLSALGGAYSFRVPACGPITYTLTPTNPLFTWTPASRVVTVGSSSALPVAPQQTSATGNSNMPAQAGRSSQAESSQTESQAANKNSGSASSASSASNNTAKKSRNSDSGASQNGSSSSSSNSGKKTNTNPYRMKRY